MHTSMTGLFATAALSLLASLVPMERSWAVPTLELGEAAKGETLVRGFFDGMDLKVTSHGTDPLPGLSLADYLAPGDTVTEVAFFNGEFVADGDCVPKEDSDCIFFKNSARGVFVSNFLSDKFDPPESEDPDRFVINDKSGHPLLNVVIRNGEEVVPEPASWALMITGFGMAGWMLRRRRAPAAA
jgi:hypothetical protein